MVPCLYVNQIGAPRQTHLHRWIDLKLRVTSQMTQLMTTEVCILRLRKCQNPRHWTFESNTRALTIPYPREPLQLAITKIKQTRNSISESHLAWFLHKSKTGSLCFALYWSCIHFFRFEFWLGFCTYYVWSHVSSILLLFHFIFWPCIYGLHLRNVQNF